MPAGPAKIVIASLPVFGVYLRSVHPDHTILQIGLLVCWIILFAANRRISGYSTESVKKPGVVRVIEMVIGAIMALATLWYAGSADMGSLLGLWIAILKFAGLAILFVFVTALGTTYVLAPLIVLESEAIQTVLQSYHAEYTGTVRHKSWHYHVRFVDDPVRYTVGWLRFRRVKEKIREPYSYLKCRCLFDFVYIMNLRHVPDNPVDQA